MDTHNIVIHVIGAESDELLNSIAQELPKTLAKNFVCNVSVKRSHLASTEGEALREVLEIFELDHLSYYLTVKKGTGTGTALLVNKSSKKDIEQSVQEVTSFSVKGSNSEVLKNCFVNNIRGATLSVGKDFQISEIVPLAYTLVQALDVKDGLNVFQMIPIAQGTYEDPTNSYIDASTGQIVGDQ
ncbi:hypothetical protein [Culicoidibacter larvae]|uniref:Uncharacterized protein n=1 Tax=Culicoidibacter larvae TaxID=2579976 RepID=A0A5R8Q9R2_9FIRM|nr:hypothetical protein [Culicoidibacter larvae]TLG71363.1 hypothetical protein FEZ08_10740 [Culicoidibacter larvae]